MPGWPAAATRRRTGWSTTVFGEGLPPIRLAAIADANTALAEDGARRYGYEKALPSWEAVAEDPSIDAVSIVVGNALHRPIAEALVAAGQARAVREAAGGLDGRRPGDGGAGEAAARWSPRSATRYRRSPAIAAIRDHIRNGELGELTPFTAATGATTPATRRPAELALQGRAWAPARSATSAPTSSTGRVPLRPDRLGVRRQRVDPDPEASAAARCCRRARRRSGQQRDGRGRERGHRHVHRPVPSGLAATFSVSRTAFGMPNGLGFDVYGTGRSVLVRLPPAGGVPVRRRPARGPHAGLPSGDRRPADAVLPRRLPDGGAWRRHRQPGSSSSTRPGRSSTRSPVSPIRCRQRTFADGLRSMEIIEAIVTVGAVRRRRGSGRRRRRRTGSA